MIPCGVRSFRYTFDFTRFVLQRWSEDRCPQIAGSLAFTTLLALVPVFAIVVAIMSTAPFFGEVMVQIKIFLLLNLTPDLAGRIITVYLEEFAENAVRLTTVGVLFLAGTAFALMLTIDRSLNLIWRTEETRPLWLSLIAYTGLLVVGPVLMGVSVSITTYLMGLSAGLVRDATWNPVVLRSIPVAVSAFAFFLIFRVVPSGPVPWKHAMVGGVVAALLFEAAKELLALYVRVAPGYSMIYGTFAAVPLFLLWVYVSWLVILFGAELTASLTHWGAKGGLPVRKAKRGRGRSVRFSR